MLWISNNRDMWKWRLLYIIKEEIGVKINEIFGDLKEKKQKYLIILWNDYIFV